MRVLMVVYCYPPLLVPASICYAKLVHGLVRVGVDVEIVRIDPSTFDSLGTPDDDQLSALLPREVVHHVVRSPETSFLYKVAQRVDPKHRFTYRWLEPRKRVWTFPAMRLLRSLDLGRFDAVITCSQPHTNHLIGLQLREIASLPWIAYFSDPWRGNPYMSFPSPAIEAYHHRLEAQVLDNADQILFTCEEMRRFALEGREEGLEVKSGVLPHAFVPEWYERATTTGNLIPFSGVRLLHTGSFYGPRTPGPLLDGLERLGGADRLGGRLRIEHFGGINDADRQRIASRGLDEVFAIHGFTHYLETLSMMNVSDGLLLVDAPLATMSESVFLPSKLIDYLGSRRPVVAITPGSGATARVVRETGGLVCPIETPGSIDAMLTRLLEDGRVPADPHEEAITVFDDRRVAAVLVDVLDRVVGVRG